MRITAARMDITPSWPVELSGFFARQQPSVGVLDPIHARLIALDDGQKRVVLVSLDLLEVPRPMADAHRAALADAFGTSIESVCIACTHTHAAPAVQNLPGCGTPCPRFADHLERKLDALAAQASAADRWTHVTVAPGATPLRIGLNRRATRRGDRGGPTGVEPADDTLRGLVARDAHGHTRAVILQHACHPVCLGQDNRHISGDYCGRACAAIEEHLGPDAVVMCLNGCAGDINPITAANRSDEGARQTGEALTAAAKTLIDQATPTDDAPPLAAAATIAPLPYETLGVATARAQLDDAEAALRSNEVDAHARRLQRVRDYHRDRLDELERSVRPAHMPAVVQHLTLGPCELIALSGEVFFEIGRAIRDASRRPGLWTVGYANGGEGYIPTAAAFDEGGYEVDSAHHYYDRPRLDRRAAEVLIDSAASLLDGAAAER